MAVESHRLHRLIGVTALLAVVVAVGTPPIVLSTDIGPPNVLDRPIHDVALLTPAGDPDTGVRERLLTVLRDPGASLGPRLVVLERMDHGWIEATSIAVIGGTDPWLIGLGDDTFALLRGGPDATTEVSTIQVDDTKITVSGETKVPFAAIGAGAADVDGDGAPELVVAGRSARRGPLGVCVGTDLLILDPGRLDDARSVQLRELEFDGAVIGEFDGLPGAEIAGATLCGQPRRLLDGPRLVAARLSDGTVTVDVRMGAATKRAPLAVDLDGDGRDQLVVSDEQGLAVIDPTLIAGGQPATFRFATAAGGTLALSAAPASASVPATVATIGPRNVEVLHGRPPGAPVDEGSGSVLWEVATSRSLVGPRWEGALAAAIASGERREPLVAAWIDVDDDGCPDVVAPTVVAMCDPDAGIRLGRAWSSSRPLWAIGTPDGRRILVAQSADRDDLVTRRAPAPLPAWESGGLGGWRAGPTGPFWLAEVPVALLFEVPTRWAPSIESSDTDGQAGAFISATNGSIQLVQIVSIDAGEPDPGAAPPLDEFFLSFRTGSSWAQPGRGDAVSRIDVLPWVPAGVRPSRASISLEEVRNAGGERAEGWHVTAVGLDAWGEWSEPTRVVVRRTIGIVTTIPARPLDESQAPWPFLALLVAAVVAAILVADTRFGDGRFVGAVRRTTGWLVRAGFGTPETVGHPSTWDRTVADSEALAEIEELPTRSTLDRTNLHDRDRPGGDRDR